jgi:hypothetical protein
MRGRHHNVENITDVFAHQEFPEAVPSLPRVLVLIASSRVDKVTVSGL